LREPPPPHGYGGMPGRAKGRGLQKAPYSIEIPITCEKVLGKVLGHCHPAT
jgi:hypothetical protein